ncbi:MAG: 50S ribosomal protein L17 [Planctomycetota bacterium]|nr:50S ribosomal protein L17 [Planctomycetota bacterium]
MRHRDKSRKLSRTGAHRRALARNIVAALVQHERIETTLVKAKAYKPFAERLVTLAKEKTIPNIRRAMALLGNDRATTMKLFDVIGPRFRERRGGYTRILKLSTPRLGDKAARALLEFVERSEPDLAPVEAEAATA